MKLRLLAVCLLLASSAAAQEFAVTPPEFAPAHNAKAPRIGASAGRYFVTWIASGSLFGIRLDADGNVLDAAPILLVRSAQSDAVIGLANGDFLVAASAAGNVVAMRVSRDGVRGDVATIVAATSLDQIALATNGTTVLAAVTGFGTDIGRGALLDFNGTTVAGPTLLSGFYRLIAAASTGSGYLVAGTNGLVDIVATPVDDRGRVGVQEFVGATASFTGVALASDGSRYLVASTSDVLRTQFLGNDGSPLGPWRNTNVPLDARGTALTWDGSGYVAAFATSQAFDAVRIGTDGKTAGDITQVPVARPGDPFNRFDLAGAMLVFENDSTIYRAKLTNGALGPAIPLPLAAAEQTSPSLASMPNGAVVAWVEGGFARFETVGSDGHPTSRTVTVQVPQSSVVVATRVAFDGTNVVVVITEVTGVVSAQRFTSALDPIDPAPLRLGNGPSAVAAGGGETLVASIGPPPSPGAYTPVSAVLLRGSDPPQPLLFPPFRANPIDPAVVWDGKEFLVMWGEQREGDSAAGVRFAANGTLLDDAPLKLVLPSESTRVSRLALASNGRDVFAVWANRDFDGFAVVFEKRIGTPGAQALFAMNTAVTPMVASLHAGWVAGVLNVDDVGENLQWRVNGGSVQSLALPHAPQDDGSLLGALAESGNNVLAAYAHTDPASGYVHRVFVRVIASGKPYAARR